MCHWCKIEPIYDFSLDFVFTELRTTGQYGASQSVKSQWRSDWRAGIGGCSVSGS